MKKERFERKLRKMTNGCWIWLGAKTKRINGYGLVTLRINKKYKTTSAHRVAYTLYCGPIPDGLDVCHRCDNPPCVNPDHLFVATRKKNLSDMRHKGRARHPFGENHARAKLSSEDVKNIRSEYRPYLRDRSGRALARKYNVHPSTINLIIKNKNWKNI